MLHQFRDVINGKAGKAAALPKFSDTLTLSQSGGADYAQPLDLPHLKFFVITPLYHGVFVHTYSVIFLVGCFQIWSLKNSCINKHLKHHIFGKTPQNSTISTLIDG